MMFKRWSGLLIVAMVLAMIIPTAASAGNSHAASNTAQITILHTNDFHGRLQTDYKARGGAAYLAAIVNDVRSSVGEDNVALLDAGDMFFAAPAISQLLMGESTVDIFNMIGYDLSVFGNHEFDKGQGILVDRVDQSNFPWLGANVVLEGTDWDLPGWAQPYEILELGKGSNAVKLGVLGLAGQETPDVTIKGSTDGLVFKDLTETIEHYRSEILSQADGLIVVVHMGTADSGPYDGLETVAQNLIDDGQPVDLMIGGHQHQPLFTPVMVGDTAIIEAGFYGRWLGQADLVIDKDAKRVTIKEYHLNTVTGAPTIVDIGASIDDMYESGAITNAGLYRSLTKKVAGAERAFDRANANAANGKMEALRNAVAAQAGKKIESEAAEDLLGDLDAFLAHPADPAVAARVAYWADIVAPIVDQPVGFTNIDLIRDYNDESNMGDIVTDSMLWKADEYDDGVVNGSVQVAFTNPGGLRSDILTLGTTPHTITWGDTFEVLPFGNQLFLMDLTGAQIQDLLDQSAKLYKGILQTSGASYEWYNDDLASDDPDPTVWGAQNIMVGGAPLNPAATYRVVTNDFLAGGQDGWTTFANGTNRWDSYYDMQQGFVEYIEALDDNTIDPEDISIGRIVNVDVP